MNGSSRVVLAAWLAAVSLAGFVAMGYDKGQARRSGWRVSERTLFLLAIAGGSLGVLLGLYLFRHKTRHRSFTIGLPLILAAQLIAAWLIADWLK